MNDDLLLKIHTNLINEIKSNNNDKISQKDFNRLDKALKKLEYEN